MTTYADSSVIVALFSEDDAHREHADRWLRSLGDEVVTSTLAEVEVHRALRRKSAPVRMLVRAERFLRNCETVEPGRDVRQTAAIMKPASLRSLDAVHLATALLAEVDEFATFDARQMVGAEEAGLAVADLGRLPRAKGSG